MLGVTRIFASLVPLYIGWNAIGALIRCKSQDKYREACRRSAFLIVSIILLLVIPGEFLYSTFKDAGPSGYFSANVDYTVTGEYEDKNGDWVEYHNSGRAPLEIYFENELSYNDDGKPNGRDTAYYVSSIKLGCFNNKSFDLDGEISSYQTAEYEIEFEGHRYDLNVQLDDLDKDRPDSSWEDKLKHVGALSLVEHGVLFLLSVLGVVGYVISNNMAEDNKPIYSAPMTASSLFVTSQGASKSSAGTQQVETHRKTEGKPNLPTPSKGSVQGQRKKAEVTAPFSAVRKAVQDIEQRENSKK